MIEKNKSEFQTLTDGDLDSNPIDMDDIEECLIDLSEDSEYNFAKKLGITDHIYLDTGIDLRRLKKFNPKNHIIF